MDSVPFKRSKVLTLVVGSAMFVVLGYWLMHRVPLPSYVAMGYFGVTGLYGFFRLLDFGPGIVFDKQGFLDSATAASAGRIRWEQVLEIRDWSHHGARGVLVMVASPGEVIAKAGPLARYLMRMNSRVAGTPVVVTARALDCTHEELLGLFEERWADWKRSMERASATVPVRRAA